MLLQPVEHHSLVTHAVPVQMLCAMGWSGCSATLRARLMVLQQQSSSQQLRSGQQGSSDQHQQKDP